MTISYLHPTTSLVQWAIKIKTFIASLDRETIQFQYQEVKYFVTTLLSILFMVFVWCSNKMHQFLKTLIVVLRYITAQLERADTGLEQLKADNQPLAFVSQPSVPGQPVEGVEIMSGSVVLPAQQSNFPIAEYTSSVNNLTEVADKLRRYSASELRSITGTKSRYSKSKMIESYLSMPI